MHTPPPFEALFGQLTRDQRDVRDWVKGFADTHIRPVAARYDETETFPYEVLDAATEAGLYSLDFFANATADPTGLTLPIVLEELAAADGGICLALTGTTLALTGIIANGTPEQIGTWAPRCFTNTAGDTVVAAFCSSEPDAGSDVASLRTRADYDASTDEWVINGLKAWATNGGIADVHVVVASVAPELGSRGQATFVIPTSQFGGVRQVSKEKKHGIRASHTAQVAFDNVRIPADYVLGGMDKLNARLQKARNGESAGSQGAMATFEQSRPAVGAMAVGIARSAFDEALEYATTRETFGKKIAGHQLVAAKLANMKAQVDAARLLVWRASYMAANKIPFTAAEGSMSKLVAGEAAVQVTGDAIQLLGGVGFTRGDFISERAHRDAAIFRIFEGTSQIQELVIAQALTGVRSR